MRILLINYEYPPIGGGAGNAAMHLARELALSGHEIKVLTSAFGSLAKSEILEGVEILRVRAMRKRAESASIPEMILFMFNSYRAGLSLTRRWRPDICLAYFGAPGGPPALGLKLTRKIPYILSLRGGDVPGFEPGGLDLAHRLAAPLLRPVWKNADAVTANCGHLSRLGRAWRPETKIQVLPNGVDTDFYSPAPEKRRDNGPVRLLFAGRLARQKGVDVLLRALAGPPETTRFHLDLAGDGPLRGRLEAMAREPGLSERVEFLGRKNREELRELYRQADILVLPSRDEGMSNVLLEGMACALPVVASNVGGNPELIRDNETGLLVPPEDADGLARALEKLILSTETRQRLGENARDFVKKHHSWSRAADLHLALARTILEQGRKKEVLGEPQDA